jgi:hypothetical protein
VLDFGDEDHPMHGDQYDNQKGLASGPQTPVARSIPFDSSDAPSFFGAAPPAAEFKPAFPVGGNLAARRAASGKLPSKALLSLQQMRFEASGEAGMGLGVGPPSAGLEGVSPGGPGFTLNAFNGKEGRSPMPSPGIENVALASPGLGPIPLRWSPKFNNNKLPRSPGVIALPGTPSMSDTLKPSRRGANLRINLGAAGAYSPASSPLPSPSSPHVMRSSAFVIGNTGPRTPLTPSHLPGAPSLGNGGESFDWFAYSMPDSPGCPAPPPGAQVSERSCYFSDLTPASPSSSNGTYLPTPGSERGRTPLGNHRTIPASPLGQGRYAAPANPFFV